MTATWLSQLGDRNPQLMRELQARFQLRSVSATIGVVVVLQVLLLLSFHAQIPEKVLYQGIRYCLNSEGLCVVNWKGWWGDVFSVLTMILPYALYIPGSYALASDISRETEKGTLNFLRLSPRSSQNILLGKVLGVPIIGYFSFLLLLPLHCIAAFFSKTPLALLLSSYFSLGAGCAVLFPLTALMGFVGGNQVKLTGGRGSSVLAIVTLITFVWIPVINLGSQQLLWNSLKSTDARDWDLKIRWFGFSLSQDAITAHLFFLVQVLFLSYWVWRVLQRVFRNPTATLLSKRQAYSITFYSVILLTGLTISPAASEAWTQSLHWRLGMLSFLAIVGSLLLIAGLSPPRQMLLDWLRGRREYEANPFKEWLLHEKSPGVLTILVCISMVHLFLLCLSPFAGGFGVQRLMGVLLGVALVTNYSLLAQLMLLLKTIKRQVWAFGSLAFAVVVPSICSFIPGIGRLAVFFTPALWATVNQSMPSSNPDELILSSAVTALVLHLVLIVVQGFLLRDRLRQLSRQV
jgi:hypothetical protein